MGINRNTVNQYYHEFRRLIYINQINEFKRFVGKIELDESYFEASKVQRFRGKLKRERGT